LDQTEFLQSTDVASVNQRARITDWTWDGSSVIELVGTVAEVYPQVPVFSRHPYRIGSEENRFKDEIRREPLKITEEQKPITTLSKTYSLIQHRDVLASVFRALKLIHKDISGVQSSLLLSEYGERMQWSCDIPDLDFDPGDGNPLVLRINCLNSVDESTSLEINFTWFRLVCANGMMFGLKDSRLRRRHIQSLDPADVAQYLQGELANLPQEKSQYQKWFNASIDLNELVGWVDEKVADEWGPHAGARVWNILTVGFDGEVEQARGRKPHELEISEWSQVDVPGACAPATNLFHVSQELSWIAGTRRTIPERLEYVKAIPHLMEPLTKHIQ
jgi:Domain of unknown function (DUF932)